MSQGLEPGFHSLPLTFQASSGLSTISQIPDFICQSHGVPSAIHIHFPSPGKKVFINILQGHDNPIEHFSNLTWSTQMKGEILLFSFNVLFYHTTQSCQLQGWFCTVHHSLLAFCKLFISVWMEKTSGYHCGISTVRFPKRELHQRKFSLVWADKFHANNSLF